MLIPANNPDYVVIDANVMIALCAKEPDKFSKASAQISQYARSGSIFYAPSVIIAETLFALCRKLQEGALTAAEHTQAVQSLYTRMKAILPPSEGEIGLIERAEKIRGTYGCSHSADGLYAALAERLMQEGTVNLLTFDAGLEKQAKITCPAVTVYLLTV